MTGVISTPVFGNTIGIGTGTGNAQGGNAIAIGHCAGNISQAGYAIAIGSTAGKFSQRSNAIAIGSQAGFSAQSTGAIAIGSCAASNLQQSGAIAIGNCTAKYIGPPTLGVGTGMYCGGTGQIQVTQMYGVPVAVGQRFKTGSCSFTSFANTVITQVTGAGSCTYIKLCKAYLGCTPLKFFTGTSASCATLIGQAANSILIGNRAGMGSQNLAGVTAAVGKNSIAIGASAGASWLGACSIAIGHNAYSSNACGANNVNMIMLNASGNAFTTNMMNNALFINPVRNFTPNTIMGYNSLSKEITYSNTISIAGNITGNNIFACSASISGNIVVNSVSATGNIFGSGASISGNIVVNSVSATGNIFGSGASISGKVTIASTAGNVLSTTGNISAGYLYGNGAFLTSISSYSNSNVTTLLSSGTVSTPIISTGNVTGGNVLTSGVLSVGGKVTIASTAGNVLSTTGNISAGYVYGNVALASGLPASYSNANVATYLASGTVSTDYKTTGNVSATGNVKGANVLTGGIVSAAGNVTGNYLLGNVACASGLPAVYNNANVTTLLSSGTVITDYLTTGNVSATGNVTGNYLLGNVAFVSGLPAAYNDANVATYLSSGTVSTDYLTTGNVSATGNITGGNLYTCGVLSAQGNVRGGNIITAGLISATGNITGGRFIGNGSLLTGIVTTFGNTIAIGTGTGYGQGGNAIAIGHCAGHQCQGANGIAIGHNSANNLQQSGAIAIGNCAGAGAGINAIGVGVGQWCFSLCSIHVQKIHGTALSVGQKIKVLINPSTSFANTSITQLTGSGSCTYIKFCKPPGCLYFPFTFYTGAPTCCGAHIGQAPNSILIGSQAGIGATAPLPFAMAPVGKNSIAIGASAGAKWLGCCSIAIGHNAYSSNACGANNVNTIILNASGNTFSGSMMNNALFINPIRSAIGAQSLFYCSTTKEITYNTVRSTTGIVSAPTKTPPAGFYFAAYNPTTGEFIYFT